jgi:hypothetical protein
LGLPHLFFRLLYTVVKPLLVCLTASKSQSCLWVSPALFILLCQMGNDADVHDSNGTLIFQCLAHGAVHFFDNLYAPSVFLAGVFNCHKQLNVVGKLHDVNLVGKQWVFAGSVALKKDLFDNFFA